MNKIDGKIFENIKGKKILITGGLGFIGSNLAHKCVELNADVTIYDCLDPNSGGNMYNVQSIFNSINFVFSDILHFDDVCRHIVGKDIVFNCAASTSHPFSMRNPMTDIDVNSKGVINLLEAARRFNRNIKFIHLGTTTQIGELKYRPADEKHPEFPTDIYSANKCVSEKYVLIYGKVYGIHVIVIRLPNVFGPRATIHSAEFNFVNYFIGLSLQKKNIPIYGEGKQLRNLLYIDDCVDALLMMANNENIDCEVFFGVGNEHYSVCDIAKNIAEHINPVEILHVEWPKDRKDIEIGDAVISNKKIKQILNWRPRHSFQSGLIKTREYFGTCLREYLKQ